MTAGLAWWEIALGAFAAGMLSGFYFHRSFGLTLCARCARDLKRR